MHTDVHTHTTFSDGSDLDGMITAAEEATLDGLGITDHCILTDDSFGRRRQYDLFETYEQRRERIDSARETTDLTLYDAAEMSYVERDEAEIAAFLDDAAFAYTIGSVHFAGPYDYTSASQYADASNSERRAAIERYYDAVVALVDSELFDVLGHLDLPERLETLRGYSQPSDYDRVAAALADSETVPEINAGRVNRSLNRPHPNASMLERFDDHGVAFVLGSDSHRPDELTERIPELRAVADDTAVELIEIDDILA